MAKELKSGLLKTTPDGCSGRVGPEPRPNLDLKWKRAPPGMSFSAPSCDRFGRHGEWKKNLATKISAKVANLATPVLALRR